MFLKMLGELSLFEDKDSKKKIPLKLKDLLVICYLAVSTEEDRESERLAEIFCLRGTSRNAFHKKISRLKSSLNKDFVDSFEGNLGDELIEHETYRIICDKDVDLFESNFKDTNFEGALKQYREDFLDGAEVVGCNVGLFNEWLVKQRKILKRKKVYVDLLEQIDLAVTVQGGFQGAVEKLARADYLGIDASDELVELVYVFFRVGRKDIEASKVKRKAERDNGELDLSFGREEARSKLLDRYERFSAVEIGRELDRVYRLPEVWNRCFTGREEQLKKLQSGFSKSGEVAFPQVIYGLGGVGKTQLALEYAHQHKSEYKVTWWINSESDNTLLTDYVALASKLQLRLADLQNLEEKKQSVQNWLGANDNWLLVFDNAVKPEGIKDYLPTEQAGHVLVTSRYSNWGEIAESEQLKEWERWESIEFLGKRLGLESSEKQKVIANDLANELGDLPLALAQSAAYIAKTQCSIEKYLKLFQTRRKDLWDSEEAPFQYRSKGKENTVATTWLLSIEQISIDGAKELFRLFAFLAPDNIPLDIIVEYRKELPEHLKEFLEDELKCNNAMGELLSYSLIGRSGDDISVHRLVQAVVRDLLPSEKQQEWVDDVTELLEEIFPYAPEGKELLKVAERLSSHAIHVAEGATEDKILASLLHKLGGYFQNIALYSQGEIYFKRALSLRQKILGEESDDVAETLNDYAFLLKSCGKYEESELNYHKALAIKKKCKGNDDIGVAVISDNIAVLFRAMGRSKEAEPLHREALRIHRQQAVPNYRITTTLNNLAVLLQDQGEYEEAESLRREAIDIGEQLPEVKPTRRAIELVTHARGLLKQGRPKEAEPFCHRALNIYKEELGEGHTFFAISLCVLANSLRDQGKYAEAEPLYQRTLDIFKNLSRAEHKDFADTLAEFALLLQARGQAEEAKTYFQESLEILRNQLGYDNKLTVKVQNYLNAAAEEYQQEELKVISD